MGTRKKNLNYLLKLFQRSFLLLGVGSLLASCANGNIGVNRVVPVSADTTDGINVDPTKTGSDPLKIPVDDGSGDGSDDGSGGGDCTPGTQRDETFLLTPNYVSGANVVFLIDDSGSMTNEIAKVVNEVQGFIDGILSQAENFKMLLIFDKDGAAIRSGWGGANPFAPQIADPDVFYFEMETWSKWADMAFARVFMPFDFIQTLPDVIPADTPYVGLPVEPSDCQGAGKYYRPRDYQSNFNGTPACISAVLGQDISQVLLPDITVNVVTLSDDDLNVAFDRADFDFTDPNKNAYPEITDLIFSDVISSLDNNAGYKYYSIVGDTSGGGINRIGTAHLALTKRTGGAFFDIRSEDYGPLFDQLQEQIIYSEQGTNLICSPTEVQVTINNIPVDPQYYQVMIDQKRIQLLPGAFDGFPPDEQLSVKVSYRVI